jgi:hypothetical protein
MLEQPERCALDVKMNAEKLFHYHDPLRMQHAEWLAAGLADTDIICS